MKNVTKKEARARYKAWNLALDEGRIVRYNDGRTSTAFATVAQAEAFIALNRAAGMTAEIVRRVSR